MDRFTSKDRALCVREFYRNNNSAAIARRKFREHHKLPNYNKAPTVQMIKNWVLKFEQKKKEVKVGKVQQSRTQPSRNLRPRKLKITDELLKKTFGEDVRPRTRAQKAEAKAQTSKNDKTSKRPPLPKTPTAGLHNQAPDIEHILLWGCILQILSNPQAIEVLRENIRTKIKRMLVHAVLYQGLRLPTRVRI